MFIIEMFSSLPTLGNMTKHFFPNSPLAYVSPQTKVWETVYVSNALPYHLQVLIKLPFSFRVTFLASFLGFIAEMTICSIFV